MKKFTLALLAMAAALAITPAALATYTLCASAASTGGNGNGCDWRICWSAVKCDLRLRECRHNFIIGQ